MRAVVGRNDNGQSVDFDVQHYSNRFRAEVRHVYDHTDGATQEYTDVNASFGIGFADGTFALGRDAARGFAIVNRHRTLRDADVIVEDSFALGASAKTGALGPALVPLRQAYQPDTLRIDVRNLPTGYDIGPGRYDLLPGAASGYHITVGSAASKTIIGHIVGADGQPLVFASGTLQPISGRDAQPVQFFTNRTGRMAATRVAPGRYGVVVAGSDRPITEIDVPDDSQGIVDIGEIRAREPR